jgi:hypothetical protein
MLYEIYEIVNGEERKETVSDQAANEEQICFETMLLQKALPSRKELA